MAEDDLSLRELRAALSTERAATQRLGSSLEALAAQHAHCKQQLEEANDRLAAFSAQEEEIAAVRADNLALASASDAAEDALVALGLSLGIDPRTRSQSSASAASAFESDTCSDEAGSAGSSDSTSTSHYSTLQAGAYVSNSGSGGSAALPKSQPPSLNLVSIAIAAASKVAAAKHEYANQREATATLHAAEIAALNARIRKLEEGAGAGLAAPASACSGCTNLAANAASYQLQRNSWIEDAKQQQLVLKSVRAELRASREKWSALAGKLVLFDSSGQHQTVNPPSSFAFSASGGQAQVPEANSESAHATALPASQKPSDTIPPANLQHLLNVQKSHESETSLLQAELATLRKQMAASNQTSAHLQRMMRAQADMLQTELIRTQTELELTREDLDAAESERASLVASNAASGSAGAASPFSALSPDATAAGFAGPCASCVELRARWAASRRQAGKLGLLAAEIESKYVEKQLALRQVSERRAQLEILNAELSERALNLSAAVETLTSQLARGRGELLRGSSGTRAAPGSSSTINIGSMSLK